jgi:hypothetical protein
MAKEYRRLIAQKSDGSKGRPYPAATWHATDDLMDAETGGVQLTSHRNPWRRIDSVKHGGAPCNGLHVLEPRVRAFAMEDLCKRLLPGCTLAGEMNSTLFRHGAIGWTGPDQFLEAANDPIHGGCHL